MTRTELGERELGERERGEQERGEPERGEQERGEEDRFADLDEAPPETPETSSFVEHGTSSWEQRNADVLGDSFSSLGVSAFLEELGLSAEDVQRTIPDSGETTAPSSPMTDGDFLDDH